MAKMLECKTLVDYLKSYGTMLGDQAMKSLNPLHVPGRDPLPDFSGLKRLPFPAQQHVIAATMAELNVQKTAIDSAECGTGKTLIAVATTHLRAKGRPYRAIVMCPGQLVEKWGREIRETLADVDVKVIDHWTQLPPLKNVNRKVVKTINGREVVRTYREQPLRAEWTIVGRDRAKLSYMVKPAVWNMVRGKQQEYDEEKRVIRITKPTVPNCPSCGALVTDQKGIVATYDWLDQNYRYCPALVKRWVTLTEGPRRGDVVEKVSVCGSPLWQADKNRIRKMDPARIIQKHLHGYYNMFVLDEAHEEKGQDSAQGIASGALAAACDKCICLTGTLIGGYANHVRNLLFRVAPNTLVDEGMSWNGVTGFDEKYGRIQTTVYTTGDGTVSRNRNSRGKRKSIKTARPGIMPTLFGEQLLGNTVYLSLDQVADQLPDLDEVIMPISMDDELQAEYDRIAKELYDKNKELVQTGNKALLSTMLQTTLAYPDIPTGWKEVGYYLKTKLPDGKVHKQFMPVVLPKDLGTGIRNKERQLIDLCRSEKSQGRQVWVYVQNTDTYNVQDRIVDMLASRGFRVASLRSAVNPAERERWIERNGRINDVIVSHPKLVETGLDLFSKRGNHNFCTLVFFQTGYNLFTLRQASRRSWRIGQRKHCKVYYMYYDATAQASAMSLMGKKMQAAQALEGELTEDGLAALAGDDSTEEMALARALEENIKDDPTLAWEKIAALATCQPVSVSEVAEVKARKPTDQNVLSMNRELAGVKPMEDDDDVPVTSRTKKAAKCIKRKGNLNMDDIMADLKDVIPMEEDE